MDGGWFPFLRKSQDAEPKPADSEPSRLTSDLSVRFCASGRDVGEAKLTREFHKSLLFTFRRSQFSLCNDADDRAWE